MVHRSPFSALGFMAGCKFDCAPLGEDVLGVRDSLVASCAPASEHFHAFGGVLDRLRGVRFFKLGVSPGVDFEDEIVSLVERISNFSKKPYDFRTNVTSCNRHRPFPRQQGIGGPKERSVISTYDGCSIGYCINVERVQYFIGSACLDPAHLWDTPVDCTNDVLGAAERVG